MATIVEQRSQAMPPSAPAPAYDYTHNHDSMRLPGPQFTNPWGAPMSGSSQLYSAQQAQSTDPYTSRPSFSSHPPPSSASLSSAETHKYGPPAGYASSASTSQSTYAPSTTHPADHYSGSSSYPSYDSRYGPPPSSFPNSARAFRPSAAGRASFSEAMDASQGMVSMSQQDFNTPRAAYPPRNGSTSTDSYGFPEHSNHGSISSASSYGHNYYGSYSGSADGSVAGSSTTDYSSAGEEVQRTLPPPGQLINGYPADATQMMTQFNSKMAASAQKKHKCKICDKRFTRPSSLQTHMYSHTGEKPFACDFEGCGRHFSVVSNLRRHKKCHKGDGSVDSASPEE